MPRVTRAVARKDYPPNIKKGDTYYSWAFFRQKPQRSLTPPKQSQLTQTKMSDAYAAMEGLGEVVGAASCPEDIATAMNEAAGAIRDVASEYEDSISTMEETFTGGSPAIDDAIEKKEGLESLADELESGATDVEGLDADDYKDEEEDKGKLVKTFDDLGPIGQGAMLDAAKEKAGEYSIDF